MIAFFGMGLLGSNFVRALRRRGEAVQVWNRTAQKARALEAEGARVCDDPAAAARGAERIHLTLSDDASVDDVLERARPGFAPGVIVVDHSTTSPTGTAERARRWAERGVAFLHVPLFMTPQNALESSGVMLTSGDRARFDALQGALAKMTGKVVYLGPDPARAAGIKLMGNLFIMHLTTGCLEVLGLAKALAIPADDAAALFDFFNPGAAVPARMKRLLAADFGHPTWELAMARKDVRLMLDEVRHAHAELPVLPAIARLMDDFLERGHAHDDWIVIAKDALPDT